MEFLEAFQPLAPRGSSSLITIHMQREAEGVVQSILKKGAFGLRNVHVAPNLHDMPYCLSYGFSLYIELV